MSRFTFRPSAVIGGLLAALCPALLTGCPPDEPCVDISLAAIQTEIFTPSCAASACHGGANPSRGLDLDDETFASSVDAAAVEPGWTRVVPGDTENSLLYQVLLDSVGNTRRMPPGFALDGCEVSSVRVWIEEGAQDN